MPPSKGPTPCSAFRLGLIPARICLALIRAWPFSFYLALIQPAACLAGPVAQVPPSGLADRPQGAAPGDWTWLAVTIAGLKPPADQTSTCPAAPTAQTRPALETPPAAQPEVQAPPANRNSSASKISSVDKVRPPPQTRPAVERVGTRPAVQPPVRRPESKLVKFLTKDNYVIAGRYFPPPRRKGRAPMAILLHMFGSDGSAFDPLVPNLHKAGFAILAVDLRGHGESVGPPEMRLSERVYERDRKLFAAMDRDVEAAYIWLSRQPELDPARFALVGASIGCSVALKYAARDRSVDAVACLTPGTLYLGIDSLSDARKYGQRPALLIASEDERAACDELARVVAGAAVHIVPRAGTQDKMALHGTRMLGQASQIEQILTAFLVRAVGPEGREPVVASVQGEVYHRTTGGSPRQISPENVRWFSSAEEAESRGLRPTRSDTWRHRNREWTDAGEAFPVADMPKKIRR